MPFINGVNNRNLDISSEGVTIEDLTEDLNFGKDFGVTKTSEGFVKVDFRFSRVEVNNVDYTATQSGDYIAVRTDTSRVTITLYEGNEADRITIKDEAGYARRRPITVLPATGDTIEEQDELKMAINRIGLQFVFTNGVWRLV